MKILVSETDPMTAQLLSTRLKSCGHDVQTMHIHDDEISDLDLSGYDVLVVSPPHPVSRMSVLMNALRASAGHYPYIVVIAPNPDKTAFSTDIGTNPRNGANTAITKPIDWIAVNKTLENAKRLNEFITRIEIVSGARQDIYEYEYIQGVMALPAFSQVIFCAFDQIARGKSNAGVVCAKLTNPNAGNDKALGNALSYLHRNSEILGRIGAGRFGMLLQSLSEKSELVDMAARLAEGLHEFEDLKTSEIELSAMLLPDGHLVASHTINHTQTS